MALNAYLRLKGQISGDIKGSVVLKGREGKIAVIAASHEVACPPNPVTGQATGKRIHKPFVITKEVDMSSPLLYAALAANETMSDWELQFFSPKVTQVTGAGAEANHYTVKLTKANIVSIAFRMPNNKAPELADRTEYEEVAFTYQKIEWIWVGNGATSSDNW